MQSNGSPSPNHSFIPSNSGFHVFLVCHTHIDTPQYICVLSLCLNLSPWPLCLCCVDLFLFLPTHTEREVLLMIMDYSINGGSQNHRGEGGGGGGRTEQLVCRNQLQEGIISLLSRWYALQMAIKNHWGGPDSLQKSHQLAADIFSLLSKSIAPVPVDDLENLLHESMLLTFNTEIEDGSIEEVAEELVAIHEEYLLHQSS